MSNQQIMFIKLGMPSNNVKSTSVNSDAQLTNLEQNRMDNNHMDNSHHEEGPNKCYKQGPQNIDEDLRIKLGIPKYDSKKQPKTFMDLLVRMENVHSHEAKTYRHEVTLAATRFRGYAAIWGNGVDANKTWIRWKL